jgi:tungstate transport system substrate-binding protein
VLAVGLFAMLLLVACGDDDSSESGNSTSTPAPSATGTAPAASPTATAPAGGDDLILATTTSTENSGLLDVLIPMYEDATGDHVQVIAVGSGAAMQMGERGDADVLLVHSPAAEEAFMAAGNGESRDRVMYNDFIIVGDPEDIAGIEGQTDAAAAMAAIASAEATFVSRGDDSGTHAKEKELWAAADLEVPQGESWYTETGQGMEATLTVTSELGGYTLTDRATWLAGGTAEQLPLFVEGDERLFNVYHVIVVNPEKHSGIKVEAARRFRGFLLEPSTLDVIADFGIEEFGQSLFIPYPDE